MSDGADAMGADASIGAIDMPFLVSKRKPFAYRLARRKHSNAQLHTKEHHQLAKQLKVPQVVAIGIGATIGAGVYVLVGTVARDKAGPSLSASFLIAGIAAALSAFCYAELASRCPCAGSAYHYAYTCVGEAIAWIIGWALILEYTVGGAAVARGISPNLGTLFGGSENLPSWLVRRMIPGTEITADPCAALLVVLVTCLLCSGIKESAMVQSVMTLINCTVLLFVIIAGCYLGSKGGWKGYKQEGGFLPYGVNGMLGGAATVFFAFIGFDVVASTAEEVKNPQRDLPLGIGLALGICGSLYMAVSAVVVGIVPYQNIDPDTPMSSAFSESMPWAMYIVAAGAVAALFTTLLGSLLPQPRILLSMSRDGLLPPVFAKVDKMTSVPVYSTIVTGVVAGIMALTMDVDQLSGMVSVGTLMAFTIVGLSILILRYVPPTDLLIPPSLPITAQVISPKKAAASTSALPIQNEVEYSSPILSIFSESSTQSYDDDCLSLSSSSSSVDLFPIDETNIPEQVATKLSFGLVDDEGKVDIARRTCAVVGIFGVCSGGVLASLGASANILPWWCRWMMIGFGAIVFVAGSTILLLIDEDEGRHQFGQSGGFHCPFVPLLPIASILINVYLLTNLGMLTWIRVSIWLFVGVLVYLFYGIHHSSLSREEL